MKGMILNESDTTVSIITFASANVKTGDMSQVWILNKDINPVDALKSGASKEVCFNCTHLVNKTCYVNVGQAPQSVYKAYKAGKYAPLDLDILKAMIKWKAVRFGAYGEPVLIPLHLVKFMAQHARGFTGYTHQWQDLKYLDYKDYFMASADNISEVVKAHQMGYRTFRVKGENQPNLANEIDCPNATTGVQCRDCTLCDGLGKHGKGKSITAIVHGTKGKINKFNLINL
jgi:hypothetical protein